MISYVIALVAFLIFFSDPLVDFFSPSSTSGGRSSTSRSRVARTPRPQMNESLLAIEHPNATALSCPPDDYSVRIFSKEPLVLYIEGFLSVEERKHLLEISNPIFEPSTITHNGANTHRDTSIRSSDVALLPRNDTVRCIEARARALQGWREDLWIERLRTQRYVEGGHYSYHFDWTANRGGWGRVSSMMAWVDARGDDENEVPPGTGNGDGLIGGGTEFPLLEVPGLKKEVWCRFVECGGRDGGDHASDGGDEKTMGGEEEGKGTTFKPVPGNAVYWENFRADGSGAGYDETWHAGLPVKKGVKVGLNIWSTGRIE
ncbi:2OG-Fe(II)oxygenase family Oxidoreductase [Colletotrichum scovillei]|uniref:2OG-Fe(II) oxygenase family Oxidoreductase n=1 Tax=Colletotrichum scovillei TaxID=1209932 RepID=A0A9P7R9R1_9PEZI|nr:2OG-Fe(II)oxygenase family Oxidoreductase [Colletotrichum scovillei]KAF4783611.1 2OG-Fe(II)oxygenase family Oxidoreductase [Colletotrichum scovillei]KAG7051908.1 2OG-Fe(II) oxygenase family Oxidoreductase [Colletotrichum scovillei]KAG7070942.1 2OG-Fe(II) oxygenase family Oxidoreductase [Colletotrichum scovillei]KAG7079189.1 2OG-Fe(II) oxygenase family Oxidoreductase [Colletotrichum scovillei]